MRPSLRLAGFFGFFFLAVPRAVLADTFHYSYIASDAGITFSVNYDSPVLISTDTFPSTCVATGPSTPSCFGVGFFPGGNLIELQFSQIVGGNPTSPTNLFDLGSAGMFTLGTNATAHGSLTVTDIPNSGAAPEPSSVLLLGTSLLALAGVTRRRLFS